MKLGLLMHNIARKNVVPSQQLVILKLCGDLQTRRVSLMVVARKVMEEFSSVREATLMKKMGKHHHQRESVQVPQSWLVSIITEMEFTNEDGSTTWWPGNVTKYNSASDTYEAYFLTTVQLWSLVHLMKTIKLFPNS